MCLPALARVPLQSAMSMTGIFSSCHLMIMSLAAVLQGMRLSCRSVIEDTVYGRADGVSMEDEGCEDESQVQSRSSTVEELLSIFIAHAKQAQSESSKARKSI
uniref:Uncharacterized protein n=2 Tax=Aegilops tauschii subsp. strangulata TaxID=200361 RepID=A0A453KMV9_AEGTS